jgi:two-component system, OmpR family, response regulator
MGASTIVVVREDLSIPGAVASIAGDASDPANVEGHFFNVLRESQPDVILLDATSMCGDGIAAIGKIRHRSSIPVVVVCAVDDKLMRAYRVAGATECLNPPVEIIALNQLIQEIINSRMQAPASGRAGRAQVIAFSGMTFIPHEDLLVGDGGASAKLTTSESRVLMHFIANPWTVCRRDEIAATLYGRHLPNSDRAVDVIVTRLRKKMGQLAGPSGQRLIKTEFRRGYVFVADASVGDWTAESVPQARSEVRFG